MIITNVDGKTIKLQLYHAVRLGLHALFNALFLWSQLKGQTVRFILWVMLACCLVLEQLSTGKT